MANPFKKPEEFEEEIKTFLKYHKTFISNQANRISDYFEMCCYNHIVRFYEYSGFEVTVENLINNQFRYKLSPAGYPSNFSYFKIKKEIEIDRKKYYYEFEVHHNLTIQSAIENEIYLTPDISVINAGTIVEDEKHYMVEKSSKKFCYVENKNLQTFCEVKQFNPFPELLFSFNGMYIEMVDGDNRESKLEIKHIAPSLMLSGKGNIHTEKIRKSLEGRNSSNIIFDVFETGSITFSKRFVATLNTIQSANTKKIKGSKKVTKRIVKDEDLPF